MRGESWLTRLSKHAALDRAVVYLLITRGIQMAAGPVTLLFISRFMTAEMQGFHYTFLSLIALQTFVELSLYQVIISVSSHEWAHLRLDERGAIRGEGAALSRLISLGRLVFKWYLLATVIFIIGVGIAGDFFLQQDAQVARFGWRVPWWTLVVLSGLQLFALAFNALLEGCNQVREVNKFRLWQAVAGPVALWLTLSLGGGLWAAVGNAAVVFARDLYLLLVRFRRFFITFLERGGTERVAWRAEIWPLQWRIGLQSMINYFMYALFTPVMFYYHGAAEAGRMGMTWQVVTLIQIFAISWMATNAPRFGVLAAKGSRDELDRIWSRLIRISLGVVLVLQSCWLAVVIVLDMLAHPLSARLLGVVPTALFLAASIPVVVVQSQAVYLRAHKQDPLAPIGVVSGLLAGLLIWQLGARFGASGAAAAYLAVNSLITFPVVTVIWCRKRRQWLSGANPPLVQQPLSAAPDIAETVV